MSSIPFLHEVLVWNKKENKTKNLLQLLKKIRRNEYDKVINLQRFASTGILTGFSKAKERVGFDKNPFSFLFTKKIEHHFKEGLHEVERNNELIESFTDSAFNKPKLYPSSKNDSDILQYTQSLYVCMSPASVWFTKQYPEEKWIDLVNQMPEEFTIYLLGGKTDTEMCERIKDKAINKNVKILAGKLNFLSSAALMKSPKNNNKYYCAGFICQRLQMPRLPQYFVRRFLNLASILFLKNRLLSRLIFLCLVNLVLYMASANVRWAILNADIPLKHQNY